MKRDTVSAAAIERNAQLAELTAGRLPEPVEEAIYFSAREAIQNATKHAGPSAKVAVTLEKRDGDVVFTIADDGIGFDQGANVDGLGFTNMRDRVGAVGGELEITSQPPRDGRARLDPARVRAIGVRRGASGANWITLRPRMRPRVLS